MNAQNTLRALVNRFYISDCCRFEQIKCLKHIEIITQRKIMYCMINYHLCVFNQEPINLHTCLECAERNILRYYIQCMFICTLIC